MYDRLAVSASPRYERKFTVDQVDRGQLLQLIKHHPAFFQEVFHPRRVNNIYLDTANLSFYQHNKAGIANRKKIRIRWYGETFGQVEKPRLEYKLKSNMVGDKWVFKLAPFDCRQGMDHRYLQQVFQHSDLPGPVLEDLHQLTSTLLNTYRRTYFTSADKLFRLTFDEQMAYYGLRSMDNAFHRKHGANRGAILELKYALHCDNAAAAITQHFPFQLD